MLISDLYINSIEHMQRFLGHFTFYGRKYNIQNPDKKYFVIVPFN